MSNRNIAIHLTICEDKPFNCCFYNNSIMLIPLIPPIFLASMSASIALSTHLISRYSNTLAATGVSEWTILYFNRHRSFLSMVLYRLFFISYGVHLLLVLCSKITFNGGVIWQLFGKQEHLLITETNDPLQIQRIRSVYWPVYLNHHPLWC